MKVNQNQLHTHMPDLHPDDLFAGRYRLRERLVQGGFSEAWLAYNEKAGNEQVVKIFGGLDERGVRAFRREFSRASHLKHSRLLLPTHFDIYQGQPYLALPYCPQGSAWSLAGKLGEGEIARIMRDAGGALAYIHQPAYRIVHQDIRPGTIWLSGEGYYLLGDFGISQELKEAFYNHIAKTSIAVSSDAGMMVPPAYRAPECFGPAGNGSLGPPSDIWAFGATLFELAAGHPPFGEEGGAGQLAGMVPPGLPLPFSRPLSHILDHCMAKDPQSRPSAEGLQLMAEDYLNTGQWPAWYSGGNIEGWKTGGGGRIPRIRFGRTEAILSAVLLAIAGLVAWIKVDESRRPVGDMSAMHDIGPPRPDIQKVLIEKPEQDTAAEKGDVGGPDQTMAEASGGSKNLSESGPPAPQPGPEKTETPQPARQEVKEPTAANKGPALLPPAQEKIKEKGALPKQQNVLKPAIKAKDQPPKPWFNDFNRKWGYIDKTGTWVIWPQFEEADSFKEGKARVVKKQSNGEPRHYYLDVDGILTPVPEEELDTDEDN